MRVLLVLSSEPVDLGENPGLFELTARLTERVAFTIAIDQGDAINLDLVHAFAARHAIPVAVGPTARVLTLLEADDWDLVETFGWADPTTNDAAVAAIADRALVYTTAEHPIWVGSSAVAVHYRLIARADAVLCASVAERWSIQQDLAPGRNHCHILGGSSPTPSQTPTSEPLIPVDWDALAVLKWQILAGTWFTRHYLDRPFQGPRPLATFDSK